MQQHQDNARVNEAPLGRRAQAVDFASAGPGTPGGEFLRRFWQPVYASSALAKGAAKPIHIMGERFTLYRGESGAPYIVGYRCAHRCTQMSTGWVEGEEIKCFYHGWKYDGTGSCTARPAEPSPGPNKDISIGSRPTREHLGLIYGYFGPGEPPEFRPHTFPEGGQIENLVLEFPCNWFQTYENLLDTIHLFFVHSGGESHAQLTAAAFPKLAAQETEYGLQLSPTFPGRPQRTSHIVFPNTFRSFLPPQRAPTEGRWEIGGWRDVYLTLVPTDDENHILFSTRQVHVPDEELDAYRESREQVRRFAETAPPIRETAEAILAGKKTLEEYRDNHPLFVFLEDAVAQLGQGAITDRSKEHLGASDLCIAVMRRLYARELTAIMRNEPIKNWHYDGTPPQRGF